MIHIATVHWETDKWVDIQLKYLNRYITQPFRTYAFLSGSAANHRDKFFFASIEPIQSHAVKLNILGEIICHEAESDDDILVFIDGDAFPIISMNSIIHDWLTRFPLAAIRRDENSIDRQPHPSFCVTTLKFWKSINGDWKEGATWPTRHGAITDVGGNLLRILNDKGIEWLPILRTEGTFVHPLWFGVYGGVVYHHGAGFRLPISRVDKELAMSRLYHSGVVGKVFCLIIKLLPQKIRYILLKYSGSFRVIIRTSSSVSERIYQDILRGRNFLAQLPFYKG